MKAFSFYHRETGQLSGSTFMTSNEDVAADIAAHTPPDHIALEGVHDALCVRIDVETGRPVDWQPPPPSADHEWDLDTKRWKLSRSALDRQSQRAHARGRISQLADVERHLVRKLLLAAVGGSQSAPVTQARADLQAIEDEIAALRAEL